MSIKLKTRNAKREIKTWRQLVLAAQREERRGAEKR